MWRARLIIGSFMGALAFGAPWMGLGGQESFLGRIGWMAGCWERTAEDRWQDEQWMEPRGGMMLGMSRTVRGDRVVEYETLRIEERDGRLVYAADPSGQPPAEFASTVVSDSLVAFENPRHDFPQRIVYRRSAPDSLHVRIEGTVSGDARGFELTMTRARCIR